MIWLGRSSIVLYYPDIFEGEDSLYDHDDEREKRR